MRLAVDRQAHLRFAGRAGHDRVRHHLLLGLRLRDAAPHKALDRKNGVLWIYHRLAFRRLPHQALAGLGERYD